MNLVKRLLDQKGRGAVTVAPEISLATCAKRMSERRVGSLVVVGQAGLEGVLTLYDLAQAVGTGEGDVGGLTARDVMSPDPVTTTEDAELKAVEKQMIEEQLHHVPVLRNGEVVGLITQRDILSSRLTSSEQMNEQLENYIWGLPPERRMASDG